MRVVDHPFISGIKCREDGAVFIPAARGHAAHWTFGYRKSNGYREVGIAQKRLRVHRLICEAFHGPCPPDKGEVDHIDRDTANNRPENLRWATPSENLRNRSVNEESLRKYGVAAADDKAAYLRARYANDPEFRERRREYNRARRAKKKEKV